LIYKGLVLEVYYNSTGILLSLTSFDMNLLADKLL